MTKKLFVSMLAVFALVFGLAACGNPADQAKKNFVGTWEVSSMTSNGEEYSEEELAMLKQFGLSVYLTVVDDGTATIEMFGTEVPIAWTAKDANTITLSVDAEAEDDAQDAGIASEQTATFADDKITMSSDNASMTFTKIDPSEKVSFDSSQAVSVEGTEEVADDTADTADTADDAAEEKADAAADEKAEDKADDAAAEEKAEEKAEDTEAAKAGDKAEDAEAAKE